MPTYCYVTDKEFIDELYGGYIYEKKSSLGESRRSNNSNKSNKSDRSGVNLSNTNRSTW